MAKEDSFVVVTDVQSVERMLTNAEIEYEPLLGAQNEIRTIKANGITFRFDSDGDLEEMGEGIEQERSMKGVF